jgi:hypothetical protein
LTDSAVDTLFLPKTKCGTIQGLRCCPSSDIWNGRTTIGDGLCGRQPGRSSDQPGLALRCHPPSILCFHPLANVPGSGRPFGASLMPAWRSRARVRSRGQTGRGSTQPLAPVVDRSYIRRMCNDYEQHVRWSECCKMMRDLELGIPSRQSELDLPQADDVRINNIGPVMRAAENGIELVPMTFSFPPGREGGAPVFNFRSEGASFRKEQPLPRSRIGLLRVHRQEVPKGEASLFVERLADYGNRRHLEAGPGQSSAVVYDADDSARTGHCPVSSPPGRCASCGGLVRLDPPHQDGRRPPSSSPPGLTRRREGA